MRISVSVSGLFVSLALGTTALAAPPLERAVPGDSAIVITVRDLPGLLQRIQATGPMRAASDPVMQAFLGNLRREYKQFATQMQSQFSLDIGKAISLFKGQILLAGRFDKDDPKKMSEYFLLDVAGQEDAVRSLIDRLSAKWQQDRKMSRKTQGEVTILAPPDEKGEKFCYGFKAGVLVAGDVPDDVARTLRALATGLSNSLAENALLRQFRERGAQQAKGLGDLELFVDIAKCVHIIAPIIGLRDVSQVVDEVGFLGFSLNVGRGDYELLGQLLLSFGPNSDLAKMMVMPRRAIKPEAWIPESALSYFGMNFDPGKSWSAIAQKIDETSPGALTQMEERIRQFPNPANPLVTSVARDIVEPLGDRIALLFDAGDSGGQGAPRFLFAWKLSDSERIARLVEGVVSQVAPLAPNLSRKTVKGATVYTFPVPPQRPGRPGPPLAVETPSWVVANGHLMFATQVDLLDKVLNYEGQPGLAESPAANRAATKYPTDPSGIIYVKGDTIGRILWYLAKSDAAAAAVQAFKPLDDPKVAGYLQTFSKALGKERWPNYDDVKRHFRSPAGGFIVVDETGMRLALFTLR